MEAQAEMADLSVALAVAAAVVVDMIALGAGAVEEAVELHNFLAHPVSQGGVELERKAQQALPGRHLMVQLILLPTLAGKWQSSFQKVQETPQ